MIHNVLSILLIVSIMLVPGVAERMYRNRPAVRARRTAMSLSKTIARDLHTTELAICIQAGYIWAFLGLHLAGALGFAGWLTGTILAAIYLAIDLLARAVYLRRQRAYSRLGPLAYLAEIQHAFGPSATRRPELAHTAEAFDHRQA